MRLEIKNVNKSFSGKHVLHDVSFTVESGKAMGFLGRNGAGKTTTIKSLMGVFKQDSGEFIVDGKPFSRKDYKVGYLPEERGMYSKISIIDQLTYFGELKGMNKKEAKKSAHDWIVKLELGDYENKTLDTLSKGNQQKIQIAQAIIDDPDILILDEPFSGLDPVNAQVLKDIIRDFINRDKLVIFSSHQMGYVEEFCDDIAIIKNGEIILTGDLKEIKKSLRKNRFRLIASNLTIEETKEKLKSIEKITFYENKEALIIKCKEEMSENQLLLELIKLNISIGYFSIYEPSLEEIFIKLEENNEI